ncbi:MAG: hypothetical protein KDD25_01450, partial [Bdellovibrionales bacterium]|nr:hypothetical protein [Bdellovibrionales bacterium]
MKHFWLFLLMLAMGINGFAQDESFDEEEPPQIEDDAPPIDDAPSIPPPHPRRGSFGGGGGGGGSSGPANPGFDAIKERNRKDKFAT